MNRPLWDEAKLRCGPRRNILHWQGGRRQRPPRNTAGHTGDGLGQIMGVTGRGAGLHWSIMSLAAGLEDESLQWHSQAKQVRRTVV